MITIPGRTYKPIKTQVKAHDNGSGDASLQGVFLNVPADDWSLFEELVRKFGWQSETREQLMERFCSTRPQQPTLSDEEIQAEVNAVRYAK